MKQHLRKRTESGVRTRKKDGSEARNEENFSPLPVATASALPERSTDLRLELGMSRNVSDLLSSMSVLTSEFSEMISNTYERIAENDSP